jgi:hypothetical protein
LSRAHLGQPDRSHIAGFHEVNHRTDRVLDRHRLIQARRAIDVDVIRAEPDQRIREEVLHRRGLCVNAAHAVVGAAQHAELDRELDLVAAAGDRFADEELVVSRAVEVGSIKKCHAAFDRGVNDGDALRVVRLAVGAGHSHAAESDSRGYRVGGE